MGMGPFAGSLSLVTAAVEEPVTLAEVKEHCRIDYSDEDTVLAAYIAAATELVEGDLNRDIMERTWDFTFDDFPFDGVSAKGHWYDGAFWLPRNPVQSITSITYTDEAGNTAQTVATTVYASDLNEEPALVYLKKDQDWPTVYDQRDSVTVRFVTGYSGTASSPVSRANVPEALRVAILQLVADMYYNREAQVTRSVGLDENPMVRRLINRYRIAWL